MGKPRDQQGLLDTKGKEEGDSSPSWDGAVLQESLAQGPGMGWALELFLVHFLSVEVDCEVVPV